MIKATDLRIGNRVLHKGAEIEINSIGRGYVNMEVGTCGDVIDFINIDDLSLIALTEEWLLRFGAEIKEYNESYQTYYYLNDINIDLGDIGKFRYDLRELNHVHQLQNLYFALTGEELIIKL